MNEAKERSRTPLDQLADQIETNYGGSLGYDERRRLPMWRKLPAWAGEGEVCPRPICDADGRQAVARGLVTGIGVGAHVRAMQALDAVARRHPYDEVRDYLRELSWDGTPRLDSWIRAFPIATVDEGERAVALSRRWLSDAVHRALVPGCEVGSPIGFRHDGSADVIIPRLWALVPEASWVQAIDADALSETKLDPEAWQSAWIVVLDRVDRAAPGRHPGEDLRSFVTRRVDRYRRPFSRYVEDHRRRFVLAATTAGPAPELGIDWLPTRVVAPAMDFALLRAWRDQLWAEAKHQYVSSGVYVDLPERSTPADPPSEPPAQTPSVPDFDRVWDEKSLEGECDTRGSEEYQRVLTEWSQAGRPKDIGLFILFHANRPSAEPPEAPPVPQLASAEERGLWRGTYMRSIAHVSANGLPLDATDFAELTAEIADCAVQVYRRRLASPSSAASESPSVPRSVGAWPDNWPEQCGKLAAIRRATMVLLASLDSTIRVHGTSEDAGWWASTSAELRASLELDMGQAVAAQASGVDAAPGDTLTSDLLRDLAVNPEHWAAAALLETGMRAAVVLGHLRTNDTQIRERLSHEWPSAKVQTLSDLVSKFAALARQAEAE